MQRTCECGAVYELVNPEQETCVQCMIRPHKQFQFPKQIKKDEPMGKFKDKTCQCGKVFSPTGPAQKRCAECIAKKSPVKKNGDVLDRKDANTNESHLRIAKAVQEILKITGAQSATITFTRQE